MVMEAINTMTDRYSYTVEETAAMTGIPSRTLRDMCTRAAVPATKLGKRWYIRTADLDILFEARSNMRRYGQN
jgi:excisionase family DNA binding protein